MKLHFSSLYKGLGLISIAAYIHMANASPVLSHYEQLWLSSARVFYNAATSKIALLSSV